MIVAARLFDGAKEVVLGELIALTVCSPAIPELAVRPRAQRLRATQADTDIVAAAQARRQFENLFFVAAVAMKKDQERIGVLRLVARRQERSDRQPARRRYFRGIKTLRGSKQTPGKVSVWHEATYRAQRTGRVNGMGCATQHPGNLP